MIRGATLIAVLALVVPVAQAQDGGANEGDSIAGGLQDLASRLESINASSEKAFLVSFLIGMGVAGFAVLATFWYSRQLKKSTEHLEEQARHTEGHLEIVRKDAGNRLRPMLSWARHGDGEPFMVPRISEHRQEILIRVVNSGEVAAVDIVASREARIVRNDGTPGIPVRDVTNMGSLEPHQSIEVRIPAPAETLARAMAGETAYVEVSIAYRMGHTREFRYRVAGYISNTMSFLFKSQDEEVAPRGIEPEIPTNAGDAGLPGAAAISDPRGRLGTAGSLFSRLADISGRRRGRNGADMPTETLDATGLGKRPPAPGADPAGAAIHRARGIELHRSGRHIEALEELRRAEELDRADLRTLYARAAVLDKLGRYEEENMTIMGMLERGGDVATLNRRMAGLCVMLRNYGEAYSALSRAYSEGHGYDASMDLGVVCLVTRQYGPAIIAFDRAIQARPDDPDAHYGKGVAQLNVKCDEETLVTLRRAADLDPARVDAHVSLAHALLRLGHREEAVEALEGAVRANPNDQRARVNMGKVMMDLSRREEAREAFAEARRLDPSLLVPMGADAEAGETETMAAGEAATSRQEARAGSEQQSQ